MAIAVVTGTSTGTGLATAATLARAGHTVYATMRIRKTGGEQLRAMAEHQHLALRFAALHVDTDESVRAAFANIVSEAGRIDVLVNNAGIGRGGAIEETPIAILLTLPERWRSSGPFRLSSEFHQTTVRSRRRPKRSGEALPVV